MNTSSPVKWLNERDVILRFIRKLTEELPELKSHTIKAEAGTILFDRGHQLNHLYLLMEGEVKLSWTNKKKEEMQLIKLGPGHFVGLVAFATGGKTLTNAEVSAESVILKMEQHQFEQYLSEHPRIMHPMQQLMISNMVERFGNNLKLHTKTNILTDELKSERNELKAAYAKLESTHEALVLQEKMATLGELVAGFAHEINNPAAAIMRSAETLKDHFNSESSNGILSLFFRLGLEQEPMNSSEVRSRILKVQKEFPWINNRPLERKMAQMPDKAFALINEHKKKVPLEEMVQQFEAGKLIHNIETGSKRVANLVKSLKSYSRQDKNELESINIRDGLQDTILILGHRLKYLNLTVDLQPIPNLLGKMGDLNQVWTNIIVNACDVLDKSGDIGIECSANDQRILVRIWDSGPGIPSEHLSRIFDTNFTTKNGQAEFGLGLGLAISKQIIMQHGGSISATNRSEGGAVFEVSLPV
ncbi:MAG: ATP-binding protein [Bacteroidota bacterium]